MNRRGKKARAQAGRFGFLSWYAGKSPIIRFVFTFGLLLVVFYGFLATPYADRALYVYLRGNAIFSSAILNALGEPTRVTGLAITSPRFSVLIQRGCDAVEPTWLFCAAVLSYRAALVRKMIGMLAGAIVLQALNVVRIVSLYWIGGHWPGVFNAAHLEWWPVVFILAAILLFTGWMKWSAPEPSSHAAV
jgi:exosortase H (IPTLxxWG-CTERM-specific)